MANIIFRTDVHACDRNPASWKGDYPGEIWSNLEQIGKLARDEKAIAVLDGGDFFHTKAASRNSHALVAKTAEIHAAYPCPVWAVPGNHDIAYSNLETLERQPLGVLYASGVFKRLGEVTFPGERVVRVVGVPYSTSLKLEDLLAIQKTGDEILIAVVHALAAENPPSHVDDLFNETVFRYGDMVSENGPDCWLFGHWHKDQGITIIDGKHFVNLGAISRGALIKDNLDRIPKVAIIRIDEHGLGVEPFSLAVAPATEVFDIEAKQRREQEQDNIDQFVLRLQNDTVLDPSRAIADNVRALDFADDVRSLALDYLEKAREG